jgi:pimeloyl-ACP methyl ester carboxylesterase
MKLPPREFYRLTTKDNAEIWLTRFNGGKKGPVMLVHGVSVWSGMFTLSTIAKNFATYLIENNYDVWLLDWRASIQHPLRQFTLDEVAQYDYPLAVQKILDVTHHQSIQAVVHCIGAVSFFMSLASGWLPDVRCVAVSQVALHPTVGTAMRIKSALRFASLISDLDMNDVSPVPDPSYPVFSRFLGAFVNAVHHECSSTVCHRMTFMYGHIYPHATLNVQTHNRLNDQFGSCNITTLQHLQQLVNRGGIAAKFDYGPAENQKRYHSPVPPTYLDASHLKIPITLISGAENKCFLPETTKRTYDWLCKENGPTLYTRRVIPGFGHWDNFVGEQAYKYVYPYYLEQLEKCP